MNSKLILLFASFVFLIVLMSGCVTENSDNGLSDVVWLNNYSPMHSVGSGDNDFWTFSPSENGLAVDHLQWIVDSLEEGCVIFVVHKTGCTGCKAQADRVIEFADKYVELVVFHDLDIPLGGITEQRANAAYLYDPDGPPGYIALTGVFTYIEDNGEIKIGWHSWEFDVEDSEMESWIKDAIYYYDMNNEG